MGNGGCLTIKTTTPMILCFNWEPPVAEITYYTFSLCSLVFSSLHGPISVYFFCNFFFIFDIHAQNDMPSLYNISRYTETSFWTFLCFMMKQETTRDFVMVFVHRLEISGCNYWEPLASGVIRPPLPSVIKKKALPLSLIEEATCITFKNTFGPKNY